MTNKISVLIADDEPINLELMEEILEDDFDVTTVSSGPDCLNYLQHRQPDILLLDVAMPNMTGYEVCQQIKQHTHWSFPILFVSARGTLEERLAGYQAGGDDYLVKPFDNQELIVKINNLVELKLQQQQLNQELEQANDVAMMALNNSGEFGTVVNALKQTYESNDYNQLAKIALDTLAQFSLKGTVQFNDNNKVIATFDSSGVFKPVESELLQLAKQKGRIFNHQQRCIFSFSHASILIKNMPSTEGDKYGRLLDHLCILMEGVNARFIAIMQHQELRDLLSCNSDLLHSTKQGLLEVDTLFQSQKTAAIEIGHKLMSQLEADFLGLGLDEDQERYLVSLVDSNIRELTELLDNQDAVEKVFNKILNAL